MNRLFNFCKSIRNYNAIYKCRRDAIKLRSEEGFESVPVQLALINQIIENPEQHYEMYIQYGEMFFYLEYLVYKDQSVS